ncbi:MAG TPA: hypothetical protein VF393_00355, partial [archaeon]
ASSTIIVNASIPSFSVSPRISALNIIPFPYDHRHSIYFSHNLITCCLGTPTKRATSSDIV